MPWISSSAVTKYLIVGVLNLNCGYRIFELSYDEGDQIISWRDLIVKEYRRDGKYCERSIMLVTDVRIDWVDYASKNSSSRQLDN